MTEPRLAAIAQKIVELKRFSDLTGTITSRSQGALVRDLGPVEMSIVAHLVNKQHQPREDDNDRNSHHNFR
jgi:hypothetical protein